MLVDSLLDLIASIILLYSKLFKVDLEKMDSWVVSQISFWYTVNKVRRMNARCSC